MKKALYVGLILIAVSLFYLRLRYRDSSTTTPPSTPNPLASLAPSPLPSATPTLTQTLETAYFTLNYPADATVSSSTNPDSREWGISSMGQKQRESGRTQTELWDGYALTLTRFETVGEEPDRTQAEADREATILACGAENATELKPGKLGSYDTLTYFGGCLGEADHHYLMLADTLYRVTIMVVGEDLDRLGYTAQTSAIIQSLRFK